MSSGLVLPSIRWCSLFPLVRESMYAFDSCGQLMKAALRVEAALWFYWCPVGQTSTLLVLLGFLSGVGGRSEVLTDTSL